jgi:hypothetical protein
MGYNVSMFYSPLSLLKVKIPPYYRKYLKVRVGCCSDEKSAGMCVVSILAGLPDAIPDVVSMETAQLLTNQPPPEILMMSDDAGKKALPTITGSSGDGTSATQTKQAAVEASITSQPSITSGETDTVLRGDVVGPSGGGEEEVEGTGGAGSIATVKEEDKLQTASLVSTIPAPLDPDKVSIGTSVSSCRNFHFEVVRLVSRAGLFLQWKFAFLFC